ncbi:hypothetical protein ACLMJK_001684 [Lecanora helva]
MTSEFPTESSGVVNEDVKPGSYTALRLQHASPQHLHFTTRRCFIGPIPEGWLKSHRKSWYKRYLFTSDSSTRTATFSARPGISHTKSITGLDGPSASARLVRSFPQPDDVQEADDDTNDDLGEDILSNVDAVSREEEGGRLESQSNVEDVQISDTASTPLNDRPSKVEPKSERKFGDLLSPRDAKDRGKPSSFVTAPNKPSKPLKSVLGPLNSSRTHRSSFVTAAETPADQSQIAESLKADPSEHSRAADVNRVDSQDTPASGTQPHSSGTDVADQPNTPDSTTNLLPASCTDRETGALSSAPAHGMSFDNGTVPPPEPVSHGMVKFNIQSEHTHGRSVDSANIEPAGRRKIWRRLRQGSTHPGEIVKMEKMLVRVDATLQELPRDYNENDTLGTESRIVEKWREFVVVCRENVASESPFSIQMYKTRVIPSKENVKVKSSSTHEILLNRKTTHVNLFSSLDKTLVIWMPWKSGTMMYILRTHSAASAVEWYTFVRNSLGSNRTRSLQVNVPDLSVTLQLQNPFGEVEASMTAAQAVGLDEAASKRTAQAERAVANTIIQQSLKMLVDNPEWGDVVESWIAKEKVGLAWKRYDRLEWVHGANEQRMYGTLGMQQTHELELRPKDHYPTNAKSKDHILDEPAPVEGFLIRLTSQKGSVRRLGKMYFKRLYFTTHNHYLCYCRPAKALPPPPPRASLPQSTKVPSANEIVDKTPLIYAVNPYPIENGNVEWLQQGPPTNKARHDETAYKEAERRASSMLTAEGYINLSDVVRVQNAKRGNSPADAHVDEGPDVDFHGDVDDTRADDGKTEQFDDKRTFELVMKNELVIRLQAYDEVTKQEWITRLQNLVMYWKARLANDMDTLKAIRRSNLERLEIDEQSEAYLGQFGSKWELLIFHGTLRKTSGKEVPHIQHNRQKAIDLKNCYIYSGLITGDDLLYQNQTFDSNHPGRHALSRVYLEDGWTSSDEDTMTCFVIWQPQNKSLFKANDESNPGSTKSKLRYVSRLGVSGRYIVFKARSRAERDHWVMSIGMEIERVQGAEEIRIVDKA